MDLINSYHHHQRMVDLDRVRWAIKLKTSFYLLTCFPETLRLLQRFFITTNTTLIEDVKVKTVWGMKSIWITILSEFVYVEQELNI